MGDGAPAGRGVQPGYVDGQFGNRCRAGLDPDMAGGVALEIAKGMGGHVGGREVMAAADGQIDRAGQGGEAGDGIDIFGGPAPVTRAGIGYHQRLWRPVLRGAQRGKRDPGRQAVGPAQPRIMW